MKKLIFVLIAIVAFSIVLNNTHANRTPNLASTFIEAQHGNAKAQYNLGIMYEKGDGVVHDNTKAVYRYTKAAEQDLADAQYNLVPAT